MFDSDYNLMDCSDISELINIHCTDPYYRKLAKDFLKGKYFGNGSILHSFYRIYTCALEDISVETHETNHQNQEKNRTVSFKVVNGDDNIRVRRGDGTLRARPLFSERVHRFVSTFISELTGFPDKELIHKTILALGELVLGFESYILNNVGDKISYGAMRIDMVLYYNNTMLYR